MRVKSVVKVMNFHSLLRVNSARRKAELLDSYEKELSNVIDSIVNNKNFILDKKALKPSDNKKELIVYIGSDLGFCSNFNSSINSILRADKNSDKIVIGKKLRGGSVANVIINQTKEQFYSNSLDVQKYLVESLGSHRYSKIKVVYNHYYSVNNLNLVEKVLFPAETIGIKDKKYTEDFVVEGDINDILLNLISLYIGYEIKIAETSSWAAENVMRQMVTKESLDKIEKIEEEKGNMERKEKKEKAFRKIIENSIHIVDGEE